MAAACIEGNSREVDENLLVCGVCSERYKNAKRLPCWHSFCEECLRKLVEVSNGLTCPYCRRSHDVPEGGVSDLEDNEFLNDMVKSLNGAENAENIGSLRTSHCQACNQGTADKVCVDCPLTLCGTCARAHSGIPLTRSHRVLTLEDHKLSEFKVNNSGCSLPGCDIHPANQVKYYCATCVVSLCSECMMADHRKHESIELPTAAAEYTAYLNSQLEKVKAKGKTARNRKKSFQDMLKEEDEHYEKEENEIKEVMKHTLEMMTMKIEENGKMLLKSAKEVHDSNKKILNAKIKELDFIESDCNSVQEFAQAVKHHGNAKQLMSVRQGLTSRFQELLSVNDSVSRMEPCSVFKFLPCADFMNEGKLGEIATSQYQVKDIPEFVRMGDEVNIKLVTDSQQQKLNVSEEDIQVDVTSSTDETVATMVTGNEDGTFSIKWQAAREGLYNVSTSVLGKPTGTVAVIKIVPKKGLLHVFKEDEKGAFEDLWGVTMLNNDVIMVCENRIVFLRMGDGNDITIPVITLQESFFPIYSTVSSKGLIFITSSKEVAVINGKDIKYFGKGILIEAVGIAVHPLNSFVYVADNGAHCVRVFSQDGVYVTCFGHEQLQKPRCICIDNNCNVMVSDEGKNSIEVYKADGQFQNTLSDSLVGPEGIAVDKDGCVYVSDYGGVTSSRVLKVDNRGKFISCITEVEQPMGICVTNDTPPRVIVSDTEGDLRMVKVFAQ